MSDVQRLNGSGGVCETAQTPLRYSLAPSHMTLNTPKGGVYNPIILIGALMERRTSDAKCHVPFLAMVT
jgi:hypothetical protein